jgi:hypothetical protein
MTTKPAKILVELNEDESEDPVTEQPKDSVSQMLCNTFLILSLKVAGLWE